MPGRRFKLVPLEQHLLDKLITAKATDQLHVAYSGGVDSKVLLHALVNLRQAGYIQELSAIHVDHGLQPEANGWANHCQQDCDDYGVELTLERLNLADDSENHSGGMEVRARNGRYQVFSSYLRDQCWLLMAHHLNDQAETLLFRLLRGCGIAGAQAIPEVRPLGNGILLRPLMEISRGEIEAYANQNQLSWIEDPSNRSRAYSRNFLRHEIIPLLAKRWPGYAKTLTRFSHLASDHQSLLEEVAQEDLSSVFTNEQHLIVNQLLKLSSIRAKNLFHFWGTRFGLFAPSSQQVDELIRQLPAAQNGVISIEFAGVLLRSYGGLLRLCQTREPESDFLPQQWLDLNDNLVLSNQVRLSCESSQAAGVRRPTDNETVWVRPRVGGETCLPQYREKSTSLKKIYQELSVPPWKRLWLPVIYYGDKIVAIPGVFIARQFIASDPETAIEFVIQ